MSKPEEKIVQLLNDSGYNFIREQNFTDLRRGKYRYDFYLPLENILIEYNGEQHYTRISYFYKTDQEFKIAQERDRKKINFALSQNIKLYIIPFWELDQIKTAKDIFNNKFLAKDQWHNDDTWRNRKIYSK